MCNPKKDELIALLKSIEEKQREMIAIGIAKGLTSQETISCSEELDQLLNIYQKLNLIKAPVSHHANNILQK